MGDELEWGEFVSTHTGVEWGNHSSGDNVGAWGLKLRRTCKALVRMLVKDANLFMYADDHQLYVTGYGSDHNIASSRLQLSRKLSHVMVQG